MYKGVYYELQVCIYKDVYYVLEVWIYKGVLCTQSMTI